LLVVPLDFLLPAIHGVDSRNDVDAGGQALLHEIDGQRLRIERRADGGENDDGSHLECGGHAAALSRLEQWSAICETKSR
jgi:hypothetical protein